MNDEPRALAHPVIAGNWKMHKGPMATRAFFDTFLELHHEGPGSVVFFPPSISFLAALDAAHRRADIRLGVQNIHWEPQGAFTGETSALMAREAGAELALIGHSERRHIFGETDDDVRRKAAAARTAGLIPMVCVGETLEERRSGRVEDVILRQLDAALDGLHDGVDFGLAYEPVWAIGTGETATPQDAAAAHGTLRARLAERLGAERARAVPVLYGGSVKPANAAVLLAAPDVDGVLVGGASLDPDSFIAIVEAAR